MYMKVPGFGSSLFCNWL